MDRSDPLGLRRAPPRHGAEGAGLARALGPWQTASLVVGTIIGTGVFLKTAVMAQLGGSAGWVLAAWGAAGVLALAGALTYAELGAMFPEAGGEYIYLREGWGKPLAFLFGWMRFWIGTPGSIAAYAVGAATFLDPLLPWHPKLVAVAAIAVFTAVNCLKVHTGGNVATALTVGKVAMIVALAIAALTAPSGSWSHVTSGAFPGWSAFGLMVLAALWATDGWNNLPMAAGEVANPGRVLPRALGLGMLAVLAIYAAINLGYFHALPFVDIVHSSSDAYPDAPSVASRAASQVLGGTAQAVLACAMALSAVSAMTGAMLTGARVPYAVAADGLAPRWLAKLAPGARVPRGAVIVQGGWASVLALSGRFDQLTNAVVFASWLFYALNAGTVLILRRKRPDLPRPFRVPGYPVVPLVFLALGLLLLVNTLIESPGISALGIGIMAVGGVVYAIVRAAAP